MEFMMEKNKTSQLTNIALEVFRLSGLFIHWGDDFSRAHGLTSSRWQMLGALALAARPLSAPQIGAFMGVSRQGAQKQLNLLAAEGLVQASPNAANKRSPLYALTASGRQSYDDINGLWQSHVRKLSRHFDAADLRTTLTVLASLSRIHATSKE